ncbi:MAG: exodeoxyribonuclease VII large subunit [bacterium]|nr:exodeoxyribonuclease VII large subunit [bacterium]MDE0602213.1 exodeoxyribonuclease VII large subunit [bacterium]
MHSPPTSGGASAGGTTFTVEELAGRIKGALDGAFPSLVWVTGEVANLTRSNAGHIYLDLMERASEDSGDEQTLLHAVIWESRRVEINQALRRAKWGRVSDGDEIKVKVGVDFYRPQGRLTLQIHEVDPHYTLSRWKKERERVVAALKNEGVFEHNRSLRLSAAPHLLGLITSEGSRAHADFLATLDESGLGWRVAFHHSGVQGDAARASLIEAIGRLCELGPDIICIVRGGGSTTDLAVFDHEEVARAIARCPVPVITGIGHELDRTVSDLVAHRSEKTPTACASWLVNRNRLYLRRVDSVGRRLAETAGSVVMRHRRLLDRSPSELAAAVEGTVARFRRRLHRSGELLPAQVRPLLDRAGGILHSRHASLARETGLSLRREHARIDTAVTVTEAYDPRRNLARGWSITRRVGGGVISSITGVDQDETIETWLSDGTVISRVLDTEAVPPSPNAEGVTSHE